MKKRLLSLLLAMAMIVSMVPFQALAEEPDETPALLEAAEGIAPDDETTEVTIPETTEETTEATTEPTTEETTEEPTEETEPMDPVRKVGGDGWIGLVIIAGVLTVLLAGAMIFRSVSRRGRY